MQRTYSADEKIRIVLAGLRAETSVAELCRREGISPDLYAHWHQDFLEAGEARLRGGGPGRHEQEQRVESNFRAFLESAPDAMVIVNQDGVIQLVNSQTEKLFGYSRTELIGQAVEMLIPEPFHHRHVDHRASFTNNAHVRRMGIIGSGLYAKRKDGTQFPVEISLSPIETEEGRLIASAIRDITENQRVEATLRENEEKLQTIFKLLPVGASLINNDRKIVQVNLSLEKILGMTMQEIVAGKYRSRRYIHTDGTPVLLAEFPSERAFKEQQPILDVEIGVVNEDGAIIWTSVSAAPLPNKQGVIAVTADVTERKQVEEALRNSEAQFRAAFNYAAIGMALIALDGHYLQVNHALCDLLGYAEADLLTKTFRDITHPNDLDTDLSHIRKLLAGEIDTYQAEKRYFHQHGHEVWVLLNVSLVRDSDDLPLHFIAQIQDITQRKQAETALAAERNLLRTLIDSIPNDVFVKDTHSRFITVNQAVLTATRVSDLTQIVDKTDFDFFPPEQARLFYENEQRIMASGHAQINQENMGIDAKTGHEVCYWTTKVPLRDENNTIIGILGVSWDITERKQIEDALKAKIEEELELQGYLKALHKITIELTSINDLDIFYRQVIELGQQRLGFDRLGLMLYEPENGVAVGTYGTDAAGIIIAEHHMRFDPSGLTSILMRAMQNEEHFAYDEHVELFDNFVPIGMGWNAAAVLWNGSEKLGWLATDNGVQHKPMRQTQLNLLSLYALTLGTLLAQKRAQVAVQENERQFRLLTQNSPDVIYIVDLTQGRVSYLNRPNILGYSQDEVASIGSLFHAVHPDDVEHVIDHWRKRIVQGSLEDASSIDYRLHDKDGQWHWLQSRETIFATAADGKPIQVLVTLSDITQRKQAEETLKHERDLLRTLIDSSPDYIFIKDVDGHFTLSNVAHAQAAKLTPDELVGTTAYEVFPPDLAEQFHTDDESVLKTGAPLINLERETIGKDGKSITVLTTKIPLRNPAGEVFSLVGISRNITDRKQLEAQTIELTAERERVQVLQRFIRDMSHDFRTPLTIINNSLYLMQKNSDPAQQRFHAQKAEQQILRLDYLLEEFLQLENLDEVAHFQFNTTELNTFVTPLIRRYEALAAAKPITLEFIPGGSPCFARIDTVEFAQALTRLLDNALAYTPANGSISVRVHAQGNSVVISVQDTGIGIAPADLPHIFERFYRADQARSAQTGGSGLGLSIAQKILEAHNGSIQVESRLGQGSTFSLHLPVA